MTQHRGLLFRTIFAATAVLCLAVVPSYAQRAAAGSRGGGSHGGGGFHGGGGMRGGAPRGGGLGARSASPPPAGFTGFHGGGSAHPGVAPESGSAGNSAASGGAWTGNHFAPAPNASSVAGRSARSAMIPAAPWGQHLPARSGNEHTWKGSSAWQAPPAQPSYPNRVALSSNRWRMAGGALQPVTAAPRAVGMPVAVPRAGSVAFAGVRPVPIFRHSFPRFCNTGGFFFGFGFGRRHTGFNFFFTSGAPFARPFCFFNGFTTVCTSQLGFFSPFGFSPFGFGSSFWGWPYLSPGYDYQTAPAPEPVEQQPENLEANENSTWQPGTVPEPLPSEQANASPLILLVLKDGTVYGVTDYWLEGGQLHYLASYGGANALSLDQLDLQKTVDENWKRGVTFVLRPGPDQLQP